MTIALFVFAAWTACAATAAYLAGLSKTAYDGEDVFVMCLFAPLSLVYMTAKIAHESGDRKFRLEREAINHAAALREQRRLCELEAAKDELKEFKRLSK